MTKVKLTDGLVKGLAATGRDVYVWDSELKRFGLRVTPTGTRLFVVRYRTTAGGVGSKSRRLTIGEFDGQVWNVTKARAQATKFLAGVDMDADPFAARAAKRAELRQAEADLQEAADAATREAERRALESFAAVAELFLQRKAKTNRTWAETERLLRFGMDKKPGKRASGHPRAKGAAPGPIKAWGSRHISEIRRVDVADLLERISERSPAVARSTFAALRPLFDWCIERELIEVSPCDKLTGPPRPQARDRVLADAELRLIWKASEALAFPFGPVVQLLMLTGQRRTEVAGMAWAEIDLAAARWRIPAERTKNSKAHEIDLSPQAVAVLGKIANTGPHVFPARGEGFVRGFSATKRRLDALAEAVATEAKTDAPGPWRIHDLRRTAATGMAGMGFDPHVVERVLNHISGAQGGLVGVYQKHEYRAERKAAMTAWGAHVAAVIAGEAMASNVLEMTPRRA